MYLCQSHLSVTYVFNSGKANITNKIDTSRAIRRLNVSSSFRTMHVDQYLKENILRKIRLAVYLMIQSYETCSSKLQLSFLLFK